MSSNNNSAQEPRWRAAIKASLEVVVVVVRTMLLKFRDFARCCFIGLRRALSSRVPLPDNDDILREILLRLPAAVPSTLPRSSVVCKRWRRLVGDPFFVRRFHQHHHPPLLGYFFSGRHGPVFVPTLAPPDCIPPERFSLPRQHGERLFFLGCRHGLVLLINRQRLEAVVWDPITGCSATVAYPPEFTTDNGTHCCRGTVLSTAATADGDGQLRPFKAILICLDGVDHHRLRVSMCIYESQTGKWGDTISAVIPLFASFPFLSNLPNVLVGNALCGFLRWPTGILEFDLKSHGISIIKTPKSLYRHEKSFFQVVKTQNGGELGAAILYKLTMELWERKVSSPDGWVLQKTIQLNNLLPVPRMDVMDTSARILGFDEDNNAIHVYTSTAGAFAIRLDSMKFTELFNVNRIGSYECHPYTGFYTAAGVARLSTT